MADEARLNEILDLVEQARAEGDTVTEQKAIAAYKRETAPISEPAPAGGGYNPFASALSGSFKAAGGDTLAANTTKDTAEAGLKGATGAIGGFAGDIAGLASLTSPIAMIARARGHDTGIFDPETVRNSVSSSLTYQPSNPQSFASQVVDVPGNLARAGGNKLADIPGIKGVPYVDTFFRESLIPAGLNAAGAYGARVLPRNANTKRNYTPIRHDIPTTEQLTKASREAYAAGKKSGAFVPATGYEKTLGNLRDMTKNEGLNAKLHPKSSAVMEELEKVAGKDLSLQEAETLRKIALDAEDDLNPVTREPTPDARLAAKIVDELDDSVDALSVNSPARALWARSRRSQMIDRAIHRAEIKAGAHYTQAGMEHALRQEFKQLALNPRRMRGLTAEQRAAVEKVAKGGHIENTLRVLGKFDPTTGGVAAAASIGTGAGLSGVTGGASMLLPVAGFASRRGATKMTARNVDAAREALVGRGLDVGPSIGSLTKQGSAQPLLQRRGLLDDTPARPATEIRADLQALDAEVLRLKAMGPVADTVRTSVEAEVARLRQELSAAESRGALP
jgi:hypothetical protein